LPKHYAGLASVYLCNLAADAAAATAAEFVYSSRMT